MTTPHGPATARRPDVATAGHIPLDMRRAIRSRLLIRRFTIQTGAYTT